MKVKIVSTGDIKDINIVPDDTEIEVLEGILNGKVFNTSDLRNSENFECE
jgi:hypothetical protein